MIEEDSGRPVPSDWSKDKPWTTCFRTLALDDEFWNEQVRHPAAAWLASGGRGAALAPAEQISVTHIPGGLDSLEADKEDVGDSKRKQANRDMRLAKAKRIKSEREELDRLRKGGAGGSGSSRRRNLQHKPCQRTT